MQIFFIFILVVSINIAWICSELFSKKPGVRILLGILSIVCCYAVAFGVGTLEYMNANMYYSTASKNLVRSIMKETKNIPKLKQLNSDLKHIDAHLTATYENRSKYESLIQEFVKSRGNNYVEEFSIKTKNE